MLNRASAEKVAILLLFGLMTLAALVFLQTRQFSSGDLLRGLWAPAYLLVRGENPYGLGAPDQTIKSVWFPMGIGLFSPLGWLSQVQISSVWFLLSAASLVMIVRLAFGTRPGLVLLAASFLMVFLFPPVLSHLLIGQFSIFVILMWLAGARLLEKHIYLPTALLVAVALTKPQLNLLLLPGYLFSLWKIRNARAVVSFLIALAGSVFWLTLPLWSVYPGWPIDVLEILRSTPTWVQPSLYSVLKFQLGDAGQLIWALVLAGLFVVNLRIWWTKDPITAVAWSLALTALASPYLWTWDFVLVLPLIVHTLGALKTRPGQTLIIAGYALCWVGIVWIRFTSDNSDERFWWIPLLLVSTVFVAGYLERTRSSLAPQRVLDI